MQRCSSRNYLELYRAGNWVDGVEGLSIKKNRSSIMGLNVSESVWQGGHFELSFWWNRRKDVPEMGMVVCCSHFFSGVIRCKYIIDELIQFL